MGVSSLTLDKTVQIDDRTREHHAERRRNAEHQILEDLDTLCMDEILGTLLNIYSDRPVRVYVNGEIREEIVRSLVEDYYRGYETPENYYIFTEDRADADLLLLQRSDPYRRCSHGSGPFDDVDIFHMVNLYVETREQSAGNRMFVYRERDIQRVDLWEFLSDELVEHIKAKDITRPTILELELESQSLGWDNIITDEEHKPAFTKKMRKIACQKARRKLKEHVRPNQQEEIQFSSGWLGLRESFAQLCTERELSIRDTHIISNFCVPEFSGQKKTELRASLIEREDIEFPDIRQPAFNAIIRRNITNTITNTDLGRLGEAVTHRFLSDSVRCFIGPEPSGVCDVSDRRDGDPDKAKWCLNVKLSLEDECNRSFEISPEHKVAKSWVLLILPRQLQMRLYTITGDHMTINSRRGGLCVKPEELGDTVKRLVSGELEV